MAQLGGTFDASQVDPSGDFDVIPADDYRAQLVDSEIIDAKSGSGRYLKLTWQVQGGAYDNRLIWQNLNLWNSNAKAVEIAQRELSSICHATGKINVSDSEEMHFIPCTIKVGIRKDKNGEFADQNVVKSVKPIGPASATTAPAQTPSSSGSAATATAPWRNAG